MSFFGRMFGSDATVGKTLDMVRDAGDALVFTEEEKVEANQKVLDWTLKYMAATNGQNVARRFIALVVVLVWALLVIALGVLAIWSGFSGGEGAAKAAANLMKVMKDLAMEPVNIVLAFYFLTASVRSWRADKKGPSGGS